MSFNWQNYNRLVKHLETMPPGDFNYMNGYIIGDEAGCIDCQCRVLMGMSVRAPSDHGRHIAMFLGVTRDEARDLWVPGGGSSTGEQGIANALHRLSVVASRYTRPVISTDLDNFQEREFLLRCMEMASQPLEPVE